MSGYFPPGVKWLLISNIAVFLLDFFARFLFGVDPFEKFGLRPAEAVSQGYVWQFATYLFIHGGVWHILFNMLALWMFGADLERDWGTKRFLRYYFTCGIGAGVCVVVAAYFYGGWGSRTIGASGAIYGVLLAFGMLYPDRIVLMSFLFPIKAKYFVMITGAIVFINSVQEPGGRVSHIAHLGGMVFGYLILKLRFRPLNPAAGLRERYRHWKLDRARRRFQVYMRKRDDGHDRWVH